VEGDAPASLTMPLLSSSRLRRRSSRTWCGNLKNGRAKRNSRLYAKQQAQAPLVKDLVRCGGVA
jgi:hypothetical protein